MCLAVGIMPGKYGGRTRVLMCAAMRVATSSSGRSNRIDMSMMAAVSQMTFMAKLKRKRDILRVKFGTTKALVEARSWRN